MNSINSKVTLNNGYEIPQLGLGLFRTGSGKEMEQAVLAAYENGYRLFDTASVYQNEDSFGEVVKYNGLKREELFITSKVWNSDQGYESTLKAFDKSIKKLKTDYLDIYLIHWAVEGMFIETWRALEKLYKEGLIKAIGVCNFFEHHFKELQGNSEIKPVLNQIEYHPHLQQPKLKHFCDEREIFIEAWGPIKRGAVNEIPLMQKLSEKYSKSPVQITLRWELQKNIITIPKSAKPDRIKHNADIFDFEISLEDVQAINKLDRNDRFGPDPDNFEF
jgi:diketogulonate reductase-like aldo/keto reductase